jgi:hypothetical protein
MGTICAFTFRVGLQNSTYPTAVHTVLCADLCRLVRNLIVHEPYVLLPVTVDKLVKKWQVQLLEEARKYDWPATDRDVHDAV